MDFMKKLKEVVPFIERFNRTLKEEFVNESYTFSSLI